MNNKNLKTTKMKKTITIKELLLVRRVINNAKSVNRKNFKWNYCLNKNSKIITDIIKNMQDSLPEKPKEGELEALNEYNVEIEKIMHEEIEVEFYTFKCEDFFEDADADETDLYIDYLTEV